jgi:hypothetical protein
MDPAETFTLSLRPYQKQGLMWVLASSGLMLSANHVCLGGCHRWKMEIKMPEKQQRSTRYGRSKSTAHLFIWSTLNYE